ncbi:hypothetical protein BLNAU_17777 [Blattamonas nauphoetae]|uniref:NHR domain-containing protein n=1 Tax=Blattamonas nauphoetae TaxID=2049346 RepID=A0ABQ9X695_9EUKA|nr:hypothetical protein BLNAU_17777 [Blattamonas nauphoetae]
MPMRYLIRIPKHFKFDGSLCSDRRDIVQNTPPQPGQEWSAVADLETRTLHFFIDGVEQRHIFTDIPVPLVFAIDVLWKDVPIEITFWGEVTKSNVTHKGPGRKL